MPSRAGAILSVRYTAAGLVSDVLLPASDASAAMHLAHAVGAELRPREPGYALASELPEVTNEQGQFTTPVAWLRARPAGSGRASQSGVDPAELSRLLARSMSPGMWALVLLRKPTRTEWNRWERWLAHRMQNVQVVHHSREQGSMVISVVAGGADRHRLRAFLQGLAAGFPGMDIATDVHVERVSFEQRNRLIMGGVGVVGGAALALTRNLYDLGLPFDQPHVFGIAGIVAVLFGTLMLLRWLVASRGRWLGWVEQLERAFCTGTGWPLPPKRTMPPRTPREESEKVVDGQVQRIEASPGDYPLHSRCLKMGPATFTGVVAPQSGALHAGGGVANREIPPAVIGQVGPPLGASDDGRLLHVANTDLAFGVAVTGGPGTGKTKLLDAMWAWQTCERVQGAPRTLVFFDTKGDEVAILQRWAACAGDEVDVIDIADDTALAIDFFGPGSVQERTQLFLDAMVCGFGENQIMGSSYEVLDACIAGGLCVSPQVVNEANAALSESTIPGQSPVQYAWQLASGSQAATALYTGLAKVAGDTGDVEMLAVVQKLSVFFKGMSESARRTKFEPGRNKLMKLLGAPGWWSWERPRVTWDQVLHGRRSVVVNMGRSATGRVLPEEVLEVLGSMMFFLLKNAAMRCTAGWQAQGRSLGVYSDEFAVLVRYNPDVLGWMKDQGRSYGFELFLGTQRPNQISPEVRAVFLTLATLVSYKQEDVHAAGDVAEQLCMRPGEFSGEDVLSLDRYEAAIRTQVGGRRQPGFTVRVPYFEQDMAGTIRKWGFTPAGDPRQPVDHVGQPAETARPALLVDHPGVPQSVLDRQREMLE